MDRLIGKTIDNYKILEVLGRGGVGVVYKALDITLDKVVVLKMITPQSRENDAFLKRFLEEPKLQAKLESPYIVKVFAFRKTDFGLFIVMEFVDGQTLTDLIRQKGNIPQKEALGIFKKILVAIGHAHRAGIIHRDVKPRNVLVSRKGEVKVTDFGLAKFQQQDDATRTLTVAGTLNYMPPEQVEGLSNVDHRGDIYSLGITLYEMLTGRVPLDKNLSEYNRLKAIVETQFPPPESFRPEIPSELSAIIMKAIAKDPAQRFQSIGEMMTAIQSYESQPADDTIAETPPEKDDDETIAWDDLEEKLHQQNPSSTRRYVGIFAVLLLLAAAYWGYNALQPAVQEAETGNALEGVNRASILVTSNPPGATVYLNGKAMGQTAFHDTTLVGDTIYNVSLALDGYHHWGDTLLQVENGKHYEIEKTLDPIVLQGTLDILSDPAGARVYIDNKQNGTTPIRGQLLKPGRYTVALVKSNYERWEQRIDVKANERNELNASLKAVFRDVRITLEAIPEARVFIDNVSKGNTRINAPLTITVPAGRRVIKFRSATGEEHSRTINLTNGAQRKYRCYFESYLNIQSVDITGEAVWASILLNGKILDEELTTPQARLPLPVGTHRISVRRNGYRTVTAEKLIKVLPSNEMRIDTLVFKLQRN